jgi:hypothetical protein
MLFNLILFLFPIAGGKSTVPLNEFSFGPFNGFKYIFPLFPFLSIFPYLFLVLKKF